MNSRKMLRKGLITYYKTSGITCLHKHLDVNHSTIHKIFQEKINNQGKENIRKQYAKKRSLISNFPYLHFSLQKILSKKKMWIKRYCEKSCNFNSEKSLAFAICGEHVVKTFSVTLFPRVKFPF